MATIKQEEIKCRNCRKDLAGSTKSMYAYNPITKEPAKWNFYGGWVCSRQCDIQACKELESSMPGAGFCKHISSPAQRQVNINWPS